LKGLPELNGILASASYSNRALAIGTLRGQHVDDSEWAADPSMPAVIIGTVAMIGVEDAFGDGWADLVELPPFAARR